MAEGGRPRVEIDCDQLSLLMELNFSWEQISALISDTSELASCLLSPAADDEPSAIVLSNHMVY